MLCISQGIAGESLCKSTYRRVLLFPLRVSFPLSQLSCSHFEGDSLDFSCNASRSVPFSAYGRVRAREQCYYTLQRTGEHGAVALGYEIIPGGLASRKFITISRARSDEHLAPQPAPGVLRARNSALRILQGRGFLRRALTKTTSSYTDEKDDGIISFLCVYAYAYLR